MSTELTAPRAFISYSWIPTQNKQKVLRLAQRLSSDAIHVILDEWDLKEGHDKYQFMEHNRIDGQYLDVERAIKETIGYGMGTLLVFGSVEIVYYEGEERNDR